MATGRWQRAIAIVCVASFLVTSCTSLDLISIPGTGTTAALPAVQVGDSVVITTRKGEEKRFEVTAVETDALAGKGVRILYADMASLGVSRLDSGRTTAAVLIVLLGILVIVAGKALNDGVKESIETIGN